jgi:hypothetical protein
VKRLALATLGAVALLAGCGSETSSSGRATVWVTRDRGSVVLHVAKVQAGVTAMQGLERVAKVGTRYGGRYVHSVDGVDEEGRRAWFYYVNGYLADRSAAEYRLRAGDVEWWDFRSWRDPAQDPVVVGSFPEPFLHGYDGKRRTAVVAALDPENLLVRAVARRLHARAVVATAKIRRDANVLFLAGALTGATRFEGTLRTAGAPPGSPVRMLYLGDMRRLARGRWPYRFRYGVHS